MSKQEEKIKEEEVIQLVEKILNGEDKEFIQKYYYPQHQYYALIDDEIKLNKMLLLLAYSKFSDKFIYRDPLYNGGFGYYFKLDDKNVLYVSTQRDPERAVRIMAMPMREEYLEKYEKTQKYIKENPEEVKKIVQQLTEELKEYEEQHQETAEEESLIVGELPLWLVDDHPVFISIKDGIHKVVPVRVVVHEKSSDDAEYKYKEEGIVYYCETNNFYRFVITKDYVIFMTKNNNIYKVKTEPEIINDLKQRGLKRLVVRDEVNVYVEETAENYKVEYDDKSTVFKKHPSFEEIVAFIFLANLYNK